MYLVNKIISKCENSSRDWQEGACGNRSFLIQQADYNACGKTELVEEAVGLAGKELVRIEWVIRGNDVKRIHFRVEDLWKFYALAAEAGQAVWPKQEKIRHFQQIFEQELAKGFRSSWIADYYGWLLDKISKGDFSPEVEKFLQKMDVYLVCFRSIDELEQPVFKRLFSKKYFHNSKIFENELEKHVISVARQYWENVDDNMDKSTVLAQLYIEEYSQTLEVKGPLRVQISEDQVFDLGQFVYGTTLNSAMLQNCVPSREQHEIRKVITIENKANYVMAPYSPDTLYIFTHGYFSPKEVLFLQQLEKCLRGAGAEFYHSGDLDYGGIHIFQFIKNRVFGELKPYMMDRKTFEKFQSYGEKAEDSVLKKLQELEVPELQELKEKILETGLVIEQESFLV